MMWIWILILFACIFIFLWTYALYPLVLGLLKSRYKSVNKGAFLSEVAIIIATYNEEAAIERKLIDTIGLSYLGKKRIIVVDSNSSDNTLKIAKKFDNVEIIEETERLGKTHALNTALKTISDGIVVITDASCFSLSNDLLNVMCQNFNDQTVGAVMAPLQTSSSDEERDSVYWRREQKLLLNESLLDSVPAGIGEFFAFRRNLVDQLNPECLADDLEISLIVRTKGYRLIYEPDAKVYEAAPTKFKSFFKQAVRRELTGYVTLFHHKSVLFNPKFGWYSMMILPARKIFPDLMPLVMTLGLVSLTILNPFLSLALIIVLSLVALVSSSLRYFLMALVINSVAWFKYLTKQYKPAWDKIPR